MIIEKIKNRKNLKILITTCLIFTFLIILLLSWMSLLEVPEGVTAEQGTLDLRDIDTSANFKMKLNGEWEFYPNVLLASENNPNGLAGAKVYSQLPETWEPYFEQKEEIHYGTYRLKIVKDQP